MLTLEQYLTPDPMLRPAPPTPTRWTSTRPSRATRKISMRSKGSSRGSYVAGGYTVFYESKLEYWVALAYRARPDVEDVEDQPPAVSYLDDDGIPRQHTFDYRVICTDGSRMLVAVKPSTKVASSGIARIVDLVAEQISTRIADYVCYVTETDLTADEKFNAELLHGVGRKPDSKHDKVVARLVRKLGRVTTVGALVERSGLGGHGFNAVARAIGCGKLVLTEPCRIDYDAPVGPPKGKRS
jgi:hypothetical protein